MPYKYRDTNRINIDPQTTTGAIVEIDNSDNLLDLTALSIDLSPIQSLNGYDKPWSGRNGKNKYIGSPSFDGYTNISAWTLQNEKYNGHDVYKKSRAWGGTAKHFSVEAGTYTFSLMVKTGSNTNAFIYTIDNQDEGKATVDVTYKQVNTTTSWAKVECTFTVTTAGIIAPRIELSSNNDIYISEYQLELGSTATAYEPYSNICPISGRTECDTEVVGKNLCDVPDASYNHFIAKVKSGVTYTFSATIRTDGGFNLRKNSQSGAVVKNVNGQVGRLSTSFTADDDYDLWVNAWVGLYDIQLEVGSTATAYEPYEDNTYTTTLGRTVYGGSLDVVSGVLTVDRAYIVFDGTQSASVSINDNYTRVSITHGQANLKYPNAEQISSYLRYLVSFSEKVEHFYLNSTSAVLMMLTSEVGNTVESVNAYLAQNPLQVCYELATPQTYQLTPTEVELLKGTNNIFSSGGDVSVTTVVDVERLKTLPTEAVSIDGRYLENLIEGYSTLYVKGRESLGTELNTFSVGVADGETFKNRRYPARVLTVGFQLLCPDAEEFRLRFNQLNNILSIEEADFIFADEQDKYFTGYPIMDADIEAGRNNVVGEWKIYCAYPFKRSVDTVTLSSNDAEGVTIDGNTATFAFTYDGVIPARPVLRATFASALEGGDYNEDGDCGFVAFVDQQENIIQLGNPAVVDVDAVNRNATLINNTFDTLTGWTANGISVGSISDPHWGRDMGQTMNFARGNGTLTRSTNGAIGFEFDIVQRLCVGASWETGSFKALLKNGNNTVVGYTIDKTGSGTGATVNYIINNMVVGSDSIDVSYYNTNFGYCNRTPVYVTQTYQEKVITYVKQKKSKKKKKVTKYVAKTRQVQNGWNYTQSNLNSGISRDGSVVTFSVGNCPDRTYKVSDIENTPAYDVVFEFSGDFNTNAVRSCALVGKKGVPFAEIPNVFTAGDVVEADCNTANVYLRRSGSAEGHLEPQYGALGNDWEDFELTVGGNAIRAVWSDWVDENYKPTIEIIFNKVYI